MKIFRDIEMNVPRHQRGVALGTFDGVHLGHQALIAELLKDAKVSGRIPVIFTFSDHPDLVFRDKDTFQGLIMSVEEKIETFAALGVEEVFLMPLVPKLYSFLLRNFYRISCLKNLMQASSLSEKMRNLAQTGEGMQNICCLGARNMMFSRQ